MVMIREVVGAHYGFRDWLAQRVTAVVMALYTLMMVGILLVKPLGDYHHWHAIFANGFIRFATFLFCMALFYHAWVGVRDIFMDYIKPAGLRLILHVAVICMLLGYAGSAAQILWRL